MSITGHGLTVQSLLACAICFSLATMSQAFRSLLKAALPETALLKPPEKVYIALQYDPGVPDTMFWLLFRACYLCSVLGGSANSVRARACSWADGFQFKEICFLPCQCRALIAVSQVQLSMQRRGPAQQDCVGRGRCIQSPALRNLTVNLLQAENSCGRAQMQRQLLPALVAELGKVSPLPPCKHPVKLNQAHGKVLFCLVLFVLTSNIREIPSSCSAATSGEEHRRP